MANLNPLQALMALKSGQAEQFVTSYVKTNMPNDPVMNNLVELASKKDSAGLEKYAEQLFSQRGLNFKEELSKLNSMLKNM